MFKRFTVLTLVIIFLSSPLNSLYGYADVPGYIFEIGLAYYKQGSYEDALYEFKKALIAQPGYAPALKYIKIIEDVLAKEIQPARGRDALIGQALDRVELMGFEKGDVFGTWRRPEIPEAAAVVPESQAPAPAGATPKKISVPKYLTLGEPRTSLEPIDIELGKDLIISGRNISRFLVTQPDILVVKRLDLDRLQATAKSIGYTYVHVWDDNGRWTEEFQGVLPVSEGPSEEELRRISEEITKNFRLRYDLVWSSFETGRRPDTLNRRSYTWSHNLNLTGETPYGDFDSTAHVRSLRSSADIKRKTDLTYFTLGLSNGLFDQFSGFGLRGFDFVPNFSDLAFPGATLRGGMFSSPAFHNKLDYSLFWGREGAGRYGNLSPSISKIKNSFLEGASLNFSPVKAQNYKFSVLHGWGLNRTANLNAYNYDLKSSWNLGKFGLVYEIGHDSERLANILNMRYIQSRLNLGVELRDIDKEYLSATGPGWRQGELGGLFKAIIDPTDKLEINSSLDLYRDRLYPAQDKRKRLNEDFNWGLRYQLDPYTAYNINYLLRNDLGRLSQYRYQSSGLGMNKTFKVFKDIYTFANYYHQESTNFSSHTSDYTNEKISLGLRFNLISDLTYYLNRELNWFEEDLASNHSRPQIFETGLDWSRQIYNSPWYENFRFTYHDEEDAASDFSFISGEDYVEGYGELSYRPGNDNELYTSCRFRNVWQEKPSVTKRMEYDFNVGMRHLWDTGLRWGTIGSIDGYVFKDYNMDGLKEKDEPGISGIKLYLGKGASETSGQDGYYKFKKVNAKKAYVSLDTNTIPAGFTLTTSQTQAAALRHGRSLRIDFGIITQTEISGMVFIDKDGNQKLSMGDIGIRGAILTLNGSKKIATDNYGKFFFRKLTAGEYTLKLDINSLPIEYIPTVPVVQKISLSEGTRFIYNLPVRETKK